MAFILLYSDYHRSLVVVNENKLTFRNVTDLGAEVIAYFPTLDLNDVVIEENVEKPYKGTVVCKSPGKQPITN